MSTDGTREIAAADPRVRVVPIEAFTHGRARNLGDRVLGHPDPGAVSVSLIFKGFGEGI